jgi:predicted dithiol-disulfide oxidoreductase (DUF899 family)
MNEPANPGEPGTSAPGLPSVADRATFQAELDRLRVREKAHTREGDAIAAARRRLPMVEVDASLPLTGPRGPTTLLDAFEGRRQLIAYYFMWRAGHPAAAQCEGCTWVTTQVAELSFLHSRDISYAVLCQGPYDESVRYRDFMGWDMPWYSAQASLDALLVGRQVDDHLRRGQVQGHGAVGPDELLVALEQGRHLGHGGSVLFLARRP